MFKMDFQQPQSQRPSQSQRLLGRPFQERDQNSKRPFVVFDKKNGSERGGVGESPTKRVRFKTRALPPANADACTDVGKSRDESSEDEGATCEQSAQIERERVKFLDRCCNMEELASKIAECDRYLSKELLPSTRLTVARAENALLCTPPDLLFRERMNKISALLRESLAGIDDLVDALSEA